MIIEICKNILIVTGTAYMTVVMVGVIAFVLRLIKDSFCD